MPTSECSLGGILSPVYLYRQLHFPNWLLDYSSSISITRATAPNDVDPETGPHITEDTRKLIVVIHGWNPRQLFNMFSDGSWPDLVRHLQSAIHDDPSWKLSLYHWERDSATGGFVADPDAGGPVGIDAAINGTEAAEIGHQHGQNLGELLNGYSQLEKVHFIAHSAGAWVARSAIKSLLSEHPNVRIELTLLDPFIPGEVPALFRPDSNLTLAGMNGDGTGINFFPNASEDNLFLLQDIYSYDHDSYTNALPVLGTNSWLQWRATDKTLRIQGPEADQTTLSGLTFSRSHPYDDHAGPIQFYADTIAAAGGQISPNFSDFRYYTSKQDPGTATISDNQAVQALLRQYGWSQSLWFKEPKIQEGGGTEPPVNVAPTLASVSPLSLMVQASGTQTLTLLGTGFSASSTLSFTFDDLSGQGPVAIAAQRLPRLISSTQLYYDIAVGMTPGQWTVTVSAGGKSSGAVGFPVVSPTVTTAPAAPIGLHALWGDWSKLSRFALDWMNPSTSAGIARVWWKVGAPPASATDGLVASVNSAKPLYVTLPVSEGQLDVHVWLEDGAGNRSHVNRSTLHLGKDTTPPTLVVTSQVTGNTTEATVTLSGTFSDGSSGVTSIAWGNNYALSGVVPITPGTSGSFTTQPIALYAGDNYLSVVATDAAGNYTINAVIVRRSDATNSGSVAFALSPAGAVTAGARWRVNGGAWHASGEQELNTPAGVAQAEFQGAGSYMAPQGFPVIVTAGQVSSRTASFPYMASNVPPYSPSSPSPSNGAVGLPRTSPTFSWVGGGPVGGVEYHFVLGTNSDPESASVCEVGFGSVTDSSVTCQRTLESGTMYFWRVVARDGVGTTTTGPVWSFTTEYAMPDLVVSTVAVEGHAVPGATVTAHATVQNSGNFPSYGSSYVHVYLSSTPGARDVRLTPNVPGSVPVLQPGQTQVFDIPVALTGLKSGTSYLDVWIDSTQAGGQFEANIDNNTRSVPIAYLDGQAPSVTSAGLQNPFVKTGIGNSIYFAATDDTGVRTIDFYYSVDGEVSWVPIQEGYVCPTAPAYGATYQWAVPSTLPLTSDLRIRVIARDKSGNAGQRIVGPYVVHDGTAPTVTVVSPNGGESWTMGSTQDIRWNLTAANAIANITLWFHSNERVDYVGTVTGAGTGSLSWTLPSYFSTTTGRIRIVVQDVNGNGAEDYSDTFFSIRDTSAPPPAPWTTPAAVASAPGPQVIGSVQLATDSAGTLHLAYITSNDSGGTPRVIAQTVYYRTRTGSTWSPEQTVYSVVQTTDAALTGYYQLVDLHMAVTGGGTPHLVWGVSFSGGITANNAADISYAAYDGSGWSDPVNVSGSVPGFEGVQTKSITPRVRVDAGGAVHVVWVDGYFWNADYTVTGQPRIYYRKKTQAGGWQPTVAATSSGLPADSPDLAVDPPNTLHLTYVEYTGGSTSIVHSSNNGSGWTSPDVVGIGAHSSRIVSDSDNHLHAAWRYWNPATSKSEVYYSFYDGVAWSPGELLSTTGSAYQVTVNSDSLGRPHVTWEDWAYPYKLVYVTKSGNQWSPALQLHSDSQIVVNYSSATALSAANNEMHVAWVSSVNGASTILYNHAYVGSTTDVFPPSVTVGEPATGAVLSVGSPFEVRWTATDNVGVTLVDLHYSADNGATWTAIAVAQPNSGSYDWMPPAQALLQVRVTARDAAGNSGVGYSGSATTADLTPPTMMVTAPTPGTTWIGNSTASVTWIATDNVSVTGVYLDYSLDGGVSWLTLAGPLGNSGSYAWFVPNTPTTALVIRGVARDAAGYSTPATSVGTSAIGRANTPPLVPELPFPVASATSVPALSPVLRWTGGDPDNDALSYEVRLGTAANPPVIATVSNSVLTIGPLQYSTQYRWQIVASDGAASTAGPVWTFTTAAAPTAAVITWQTPAALLFGTALSETELNALANVPGMFDYAPPAGTVLALGTHTLSVAFTPTDMVNYAAATKTVTIDVNPTVGGTAVPFDFDGDRKSDILWRHGTQGDMWLWRMEGATRTQDLYVGMVADASWEIRGQGDLDGDGTADLLWRHKTDGTIYYWRMQGGAPVAELYVATVDVSYDIVGTGDFDGDGRADILWRNPTLGDLWLWRMNGAEVLGQTYIDTVDLGYTIKGLGDLNGDTKTDLVWAGTAGDVWVWLMNGAVRDAQAYVGTVTDAHYQIQQVADFDGLGKADLLWWNTVQGDVWIWSMNGATVVSESYVGTVPDTNYRVMAAGDYNGDGKADVLWRNIAQGDVWVWLMDGTTKLSENYVGTVPDLGYQIVKVR